jgi:hypothetical protein
MKDRIVLSYVLPALLASFLALACGGSTFAQGNPAEWTILFYMDSDNDLEAPQMEDLDEIMAVGSNANINLVVLSDRNIKGNNERGYTARNVGGLPNWTSAKLMVIQKGQLRELADWGEVNMGDPATLKRFLQTATAEFPANRFGVVFGNHGSGWPGIVGDESHNGDTLNTLELQSVFSEVTAGIGKFELIGFDACLMANFEVAKTLSPFGKAMVASEELEPGNGWDYTPLMTALAGKPQMDGLEFGKNAVNTYRNYYLGPNEGARDKTVTLSVIDLSKIPALEKAVSDLGLTNMSFIRSKGRETWLKTARARSITDEYGAGESPSHFYDLVNYAENLKKQQPDSETASAADAVISAAKAAVVHKIAGEGHPGSHGISIYFPPDKTNLTSGGYELTPFSKTGKWFPFLADYTGIGVADVLPPQLKPVAVSDPSVEQTDVVTVTTSVAGDDIEEATFVLAELSDTEQIIIGAIPAEPDENGQLTEEWDGSWFTIGDGTKEVICPITNFEAVSDEEDTYIVEIPAQIRFAGSSAWRDVSLYFYLDFNKEQVVGEFIYAFEFRGNQAREIDVEAGDSIRPTFLSIDNNGDTSLVAPTDETDLLNVTDEDNIKVGRADVAPGKYLIGFTVTDFSGNTNEEFTEVTLR